MHFQSYVILADLRKTVLHVIFYVKYLQNGEISVSHILFWYPKKSVLLIFCIFYRRF